MSLYTYKATVVRVVDGDTVWLTIDLGFRLSMTASCRLSGINAPELGTDAGAASKTWLTDRLPAGTAVSIVSSGLDKYGRPIVAIWEPVTTSYDPATTVNQQMLTLGLAVAYEGAIL